MKTYDATRVSKAWNDAYARDKHHERNNGFWVEHICWAKLLNEGYTHVRIVGGLFTMNKLGPCHRVSLL
jgi:hypothetical protein